MSETPRNGPTKRTTIEVVNRVSSMCWNFRKPETRDDFETLVSMWQEALSGNYYQQHVYLDAVTSWLKTADVKSAPPYPGDILRHCRLVVEEMERDPSRRDDLYSWRDQVRALKS